MMSKTVESLNELSVLTEVIKEMEEKQQDHPEYIVKNIELTDKIIQILQKFKNSLIEKLPTS